MKKDFRLAPIFMNNMVLQAKKPLYSFGEGKIGSLIEIQILNKYYTFIIEESNFCFRLDPLPIIKIPFDVLIKSNDQTVILTNCLAGDIYLCTGQSNMQYVCKDVEGVIYKEIPSLRLYEVPKLPYIGAEKEFDWLYTNNPKWLLAEKKNIELFSAIGYMIGRDIYFKHDIPVGIISCNQGDTTIYSWLSKKVINENKVLRPYLDDYNTWKNKYKTYEEFSKYYNKQVPKLMDFWGLLDKFRAEGYSSDKVYELAYKEIPYPYLPMGPKNQNRPSGCYDTMLSSIIPFANRCIIYYQGENDVSRAKEYRVAIKELIKSWRSDFRDNLPFINIQIAGHIYSDTSSDDVADLRDAQASILDINNQQYVTSAIDYGEKSNIHPIHKNEVAKRVFNIIDEYIYNTNKNSLHPVYSSYDLINDSIKIHTINNDYPLFLRNTMKTGFIGINIKKEAVDLNNVAVDNHDVIIYGIKNIKEIRYAYSYFPELTVYTANQLPLLPFKIRIK